ncbi:MAG: Apolipoprotein N-acyltransferase [Alphaproteobacteria bacterium MarineAlpha5_Bin9]|nr:MAG: Apolipoprotein N-acyltransferase [Alphaproteobacteria bacterium MarineAlpha5_Bin9]
MIRYLKFLFCGAISSLLFPPFLFFPIGFIVCPFLFYLIIDKKNQNLNKTKIFLNGFFYGLGLNSILLNWIKEPFLVDLNTADFFWFSYLLIIYVSIYFGFIFLFLSYFKKNLSKLIILPSLIVTFEIIRANFIYGFPWVTFSLAASDNLYLLQIAYYLGTEGLSLYVLTLFFSPILIYFLIIKYQIKQVYFIISIFIFLSISLFYLSYNRLHNDEKFSDKKLVNLSINQLNYAENEKNLEEIHNIISKNTNTMYIFSEIDYPHLVDTNFISSDFKKSLKTGSSVLIGGIRKINNNFYNSLFYVSNKNFEIFDKKILVPFGEFLPFRKYLKFLSPISGNIDLQKGKNQRLINSSYHFSFIPIICYEIIFNKLILTKDNVNFPIMVNITNDSWFGEYSGPFQHFYLSRIRSVEFNKYLVRVSNNGISAIIDNYGNIINMLPLNKTGKIEYQLFIPESIDNKYRYHFIIYIILLFLFFVAILIDVIFRKSKN